MGSCWEAGKRCFGVNPTLPTDPSPGTAWPTLAAGAQTQWLLMAFLIFRETAPGTEKSPLPLTSQGFWGNEFSRVAIIYLHACP